jgi:hypothetical protein
MSSEKLEFSGEQASEWENYISELNGVGISLDNTKDTLLWTGGDSSGNITVKNIYAALISTQQLPIWRGWRVNIWKWKLQLKIKIFLWLAADNRILTWEVLNKKGWEGPGICILCKHNTEDINHLFVHCSFSKTVWSRIPIGYILKILGLGILL